MKFTLIGILLTIVIVELLAALALRRSRKTKAHFANIGEGTRETGHVSLLYDTNASPVTGTRFLLVKKNTDGDHISTCTTNDVSIGICQDAFDANNTDVQLNVALHGASPGTQRVVTDGTITDGIPIKAGTNGQATAATTGDAGIFGRACFGSDTTSAAGDIITCVTDVPSKMAF